jgi:hypothetical protein
VLKCWDWIKVRYSRFGYRRMCRLMIDDVEDEWVSGSGWHFAHFRSMALVLRDLQRAVDQTFR